MDRSGGSVDLLSRYLDEIGRRPLLSAAEERALSERVQAGVRASARLAEPGVPQAERRRLRRIVTDGDEARNTFVEANLRLVVSIARHYQRRHVDLLDLIQEGNVGLVRAVDRYDGRLGNRFSTYATWWIRRCVTRALDTSVRSIRLPAHREAERRALARAMESLEAGLHRPATVGELADATGLGVDRVRADLQLPLSTVSLSAPLADDTRCVGDAVADPDALSPEDLTTEQARCAEVTGLVAKLPPRQARLIELRFGLRTGEPLSRGEVADLLGITRERVRQLEQRALAKLRRAAPPGFIDQLLDVA